MNFVQTTSGMYSSFRSLVQQPIRNDEELQEE